ncbi:MAG: OsmC family protein [Gammaproteobacteria bacterium]
MTRHTASIEWEAGAEGFARGRFSRVHRWRFDGGIELTAAAAPSVIPAQWTDAAAVDPEEAFVAAIASCHMMSFLHLANRDGLVVARYADDAVGHLEKRADGERWIARVELHPDVTWAADTPVDAAAESALHERAHRICFIANSVASIIVVTPRRD